MQFRDHIFIHIGLLIIFVIFLYGSLKSSIGKIIALILIYQTVISVVLNTYFFAINEPFGYNAVDAFYYLHLSEYALSHSLGGFIAYLQSMNTEISDYGFPVIRFFIFNLAGNLERGIVLMVIFDAISMTIGSWYLYRLSLFFLKKQSAKIVALFWGLNTCSIIVNIKGIKESIFTTILIIAMYQLYIFYFKKKSITNYILLLLPVAFTVFFRIYLTIFFIIVILFKPLYEGKFKQFALFAVVFLTCVVTYLGHYITTELPILSILLSVQKKNSSSFLFINMISGFLGPYPNFLQPGGNITSLFWAPYSGFKTFFSIFALYGGWYILKNRVTRLYPMFFFIFFNILLVIGTVRSLDFRFSYTMIPFFYILIMYGCNRFKFIQKKIYSLLYFCFIFLLVTFYNIR
jgi:hypothetical protein